MRTTCLFAALCVAQGYAQVSPAQPAGYLFRLKLTPGTTITYQLSGTMKTGSAGAIKVSQSIAWTINSVQGGQAEVTVKSGPTVMNGESVVQTNVQHIVVGAQGKIIFGGAFVSI